MLLCILLSIVVFSSSQCCNVTSDFRSSMLAYPADGKSSGAVILERSFFDSNDRILLPDENNGIIRVVSVESSEKREVLRFQSTLKPGSIVLKTVGGEKLELIFYPLDADLDDDGFPDRAELDTNQDRKAFVDWFIRISESQFLKKNYSWSRKQRDCAGLIRYAYREALKKHDQGWLKKSGIILDKNLSDVAKYNYPHIPFMGERLFKIRRGAAQDITTFGHFVDADTLLNLNTSFVSRELTQARRGDLLFFRDDENISSPYHSMIVAEISGSSMTLIYHTGSQEDIVKRVPLDYLNKSKIFRPVEWNKHFLGIYRFLILE